LTVAETLWIPDPERIATSNLARFATELGARSGHRPDGFAEIHALSVAEPALFWETVWDTAGVTASARGEAVISQGERFSDCAFFPDARLNFAQNLLSARGPEAALLFADEAGNRRVISWDELHCQVSQLQQALAAAGVGRGDRVAAWLPNLPESYVLLTAAASLGAVFSSCSPDFGIGGVLDRFGQIEPKVLVAADGYHYGGRAVDCLGRLAELVDQLPTVESTVVVPYLSDSPDLSGVPAAETLGDFVSGFQPADVTFEQLPFDHPLYVLYSSGTTGIPKSIVHRAGGILLKHLVEHQLHCDVRRGDRVFYFTTMGWMMWNWLASGLASGATLVLYDGNPVHPHPGTLFDLADEFGISLFGTSAKFIESMGKAGLRPGDTHDLSALRTITSTGSPLSDAGFRYVYDAIKADVHLASISGGTDLCGCLVAGDPTGPVRAGEIQAPGLGMDIDVIAPDGKPLPPLDQGELICRSPFPSMPLGFWGDDSGKRYQAAYFDAYPGVWHQGDYASWTESGGMIIHGRSDATLNPGGVRIGTAEIYRQVETITEILESLVVGQPHQNDVRVVLFVRLAEVAVLDDELVAKIRSTIRTGASPRHVPAVVIEVADLPRTRSGKLTELAVRDVLAGRPVANTEALANPEALELFRNLPQLSSGGRVPGDGCAGGAT
jgi:acetoacetyl-CoA synthetase